MKWAVIFLLILMFPFISACEEGQIDINSASLEELDILYGIGPVKSQSIMDSRPFDSVDELINVKGIGEITLEKIKNQNLACVGETEKVEEEKEIIIEEIIGEENIIRDSVEEKEVGDPLPKIEPISLNPKVIKTDNPEESYNVYAILGLVTFSILLVLLFMLNKLKTDKNEFDSD